MIQIEPVMTRKTIKHAEGEGQNIVRVIGPAAQMQKEDEVDADLREGEHDRARPVRPEATANSSARRRTRRSSQDREPEPRRVRQIVGRGLLFFDTRCAVVETRDRHRPSAGSHQIDQGEHPDPDDVQRVPEQAEAQQAPQHVRPQALGDDLRHHIDEENEAAGDVDAVRADQGEKAGKKGAARGPGALR